MNKIRIVLIEDHDLTRLGLRATFQQSETVEIVGEAANGQEGLRLLQRTRPDVAVVDIGLPIVDGVELTRQFKQMLAEAESSQFVTTKIMMLTLQDTEEAVLAAFAAGADSYCLKDANAQTLLKALMSTYEGNHWIDPAIARVVLQNTRHPQHPQAARATAGSPTIAIAVDDSCKQLLETYPLTERELEILEQIVSGCSNATIASKLYITVGTVKTHVRNILNKLCVDDRTQAAVRALRAGLIS
jgi:two-component system, NarL family, response regulator LiaR